MLPLHTIIQLIGAIGILYVIFKVLLICFPQYLTTVMKYITYIYLQLNLRSSLPLSYNKGPFDFDTTEVD